MIIVFICIAFTKMHLIKDKIQVTL